MSLEDEERMLLEDEKRMLLEDEKRKKKEEVKREIEEKVKEKVIGSVPIGKAKLQVKRRVVYRASAGCVDRLGTVMGVHKTLISKKYCFTYSVKLDPIVVNSSSLQVRSENMYRGEKIAPGSQVIFTEQEVWNDKVWNGTVWNDTVSGEFFRNDTVSGKFFHYSNATITEVDTNSLTCTIQLDNVRAQNEMIRNAEESDENKSDQTPVLHISKESLSFWAEDTEMQFGQFSDYRDSIRCAYAKELPDSDDSDFY